MKTVQMTEGHIYRPRRSVIVEYRAGQTYQRVPEAAVRSILAACAGYIVSEDRSADDKPVT